MVPIIVISNIEGDISLLQKIKGKQVMNRLKTILFWVLLTATAGLWASVAVQSYNVNHAEWEAENTCIAGKVETGVKRSTIVRDNGGCYVKEDLQY